MFYMITEDSCTTCLPYEERPYTVLHVLLLSDYYVSMLLMEGASVF